MVSATREKVGREEKNMILQKINASPVKRIPAAMAMLCLGLLLVILNTLWSRIGWLSGTGWSDFARGLVIGIGIALETGGVLLAASAVKQRKRS